MDFRFLEFLKEIINDTLYASIAKLAIAFYLGKKFIQFLITAFNIAYKKKEEQKEDIQYKKDVIELKEAQKKADLANEKRDLKTHEILNKLDQKVNKLEKDLNAYKDKKHDIETKNIANLKIIERSTDAIEKNNNLFEKLNNKL
jgi:ABC-type transport system involved in cytochrome bd biosynthesis fused ATPase/permease subunit